MHLASLYQHFNINLQLLRARLISLILFLLLLLLLDLCTMIYELSQTHDNLLQNLHQTVKYQTHFAKISYEFVVHLKKYIGQGRPLFKNVDFGIAYKSLIVHTLLQNVERLKYFAGISISLNTLHQLLPNFAMAEYRMLLLNFLLQYPFLHKLFPLPKASHGPIQEFFGLGPCLVKAHHLLVVVVVVLLTHSILKWQSRLQLTIGMRPKREVPLSTLLTEQTPITSKSVSLQNRNITMIDLVSPLLCPQIQSLNLRKNKLTSLKNITQFAFLKELDLSSNKINNCRQLAHLRDMYQLRKVYVSDNPFLSEPLDQPILDFLLQRETDIEILSFEVLNSIREVEQDEIKIIFLKNYLGKIELHEQLKQKELVREVRPGMKTEQLIDKIIPQFYTIIDDPNMTTKIRREALDLKRKNNATIEYALKSTKHDKCTKINQLIGDVVNLLHHNSTFKKESTFRLEVNYDENTISFSPDREKPFNNSKRIEESEEQFSPVKYMELSKDNTFQQFSLANSNRHAPLLSNLREKVPNTPATEQFQTTRKLTPPKVPLVEKLNNFSNFKQNYQSQLKRIRERQSTAAKNNDFTPIKIQQPTLPTRNAQTNSGKPKIGPQPEFIKVIEQKDSIESNREQSFKKSPNAQVKYNQESNAYRNSLIASRESLTSQTFETIYLRNLNKTNPMFNLLHSPTNSLTQQEKTTILESLKLDHKQKCIELMKQRNNNLTLTRELDQARTEFHYKMDSIVGNSRCAFQENAKLKEDYEWLQHRFENLQTDYHTVFNQLKEAEQRERGKTTAISIMEGSYKKIRDSLKERVDELSQLAVMEQKEEKLAERHSQFIKSACLRQLKAKATRWLKIIQAMTASKDRRQHRLKTIGLESFKLSKQFEEGLKRINTQRQHTIMLHHFSEWVFFKQTEAKQKLLFNRMKRKRCEMGMNKLKKYEANSKMRKLKNIWANRFLHQRIFDNGMGKWKELRRIALSKQQKAIHFHKARILSQYLGSIRLLMNTRRQRIKIFASQYLQRKKERQFKRMVHLIRKEQVQLQHKEKQTSRLHQATMRKTYIQRLKQHTTIIKQLNKKYKVLLLKKYQTFCSQLKENQLSNLAFRQKNGRLLDVSSHKATLQKLKLIKYLQIARLRGKNYIKYRTIQEMNTQMDHNDRNALELVRFTQEEVDIYKRDASHLKQLIFTQQNRQKQLLLKNDSLLLNIKETLDVVDEMRAQMSSLERQYLNQLHRNEALSKLYSEATNRVKGKHIDANQQF